MQRILALDPGGTTGWAMWQEGGWDEQREEVVPELYTEGQIGPSQHHYLLWQYLKSVRAGFNLTVVCESFEFRQQAQRNNLNLMSKEYIGIVKLFGEIERINVVFQTAAMAKPFITDAKLKVMGRWVPGKKHSNDAYRHLLYYMITHGHQDLVESWKNL